ncbi:hypothetical protein HF670_11835 [Acidithiobacillus thiooxidans]|nr:hypothetical protein [Acidithiobacillus thiooxidans]
MAKDAQRHDDLHRVSTVTLNGFRLLVTLLSPVLPSLTTDAMNFLQTRNSWEGLDQPLLNHSIQCYQHLLQRMEKTKVDALIRKAV